MNCWKPLRAETLQHSEQSQVRKVEKFSDWAISSQADEKSPEGSTTRTSNLTPIVQMYESGLTVREIGKAVGASSNTVRRFLVKQCVKMRKPGQRLVHQKLDDPVFLMAEYWTANKSAEVIAKEQRSTPKTVIELLRKHGIEVRRTNKGRKFPDVGKKHSEWLKGRFVGEKNPNWRGGKIDPNMRLRTSHQAKEWSKAVRERDGHKCVECGKTGRLHAHHIKSWKHHPELRFDVSNGKTLCPICHQHAHGFKFPDWAMDNVPRVQNTLLG